MNTIKYQLYMRTAISFIILLFAFAACHQTASHDNAVTPAINASNDSTIYGLACEGSNDTVIIFLREPYTGGNPDTLGILKAMQHQQVFGTIHTGDRLAILQSQEDSTQAKLVIVMERLLGTWCYLQKPSLRQRADMEGLTEQEVLATLPDSVRNMLDNALEYGFTLKIDSMALPLWNSKMNQDAESPIEYPKLKLYRQWCINNGKLLLTESFTDSAGVMQFMGQDTAQLVTLSDDSLVLRFTEEQQSYYRKDDTPAQ